MKQEKMTGKKTMEFCVDCERWFLAGPSERFCRNCKKKRIANGQKRRREAHLQPPGKE